MNKLNKKGFTLIEMLVVIAIIAVLVSIIIPVVSGSTEKAAAAANAANLRSMKAEAVTAMLAGKTTSTANITVTFDSSTGKVTKIEATDSAPTAKACTGVTKGQKAVFYLDATTGDVIPFYAASGSAITGDPAKTAGTIEYFAYIAETGSAKQ